MAENSASIRATSYKQSVSKRVRIGFKNIFKRSLDIIVSLLGLLFLSPLFILIAFLIRHDSEGPIFYRGHRCGKSGKVFHILKFRTMYDRPESYDGPRVTARDDPRITPLGSWLRETKLNELPQLWNVLKGEMSLVGPRPEDPEIAATWPKAVQKEVLAVRPGITSPASVLYRNEEAMLDTGEVMDTYLDAILPSKLRLDQLYVRNRSFWLDLDILFWTFLVLLPKVGSYQPPEENIFWGPVSRFFRHYVSWFMIDTLTTFVAMGLTGLFWRSLGPLNLGWPKAIGFTLGFAIIFSLTGALMGVNRISWPRASTNDVYDIFIAAIVATGISLLFNKFLQKSGMEFILPSGMILMAASLAFLGFVLVRYRSRLLSGLATRWLNFRGGARAAQEKVLIIGGGEAGQFVAWLMGDASNLGAFHVTGFVDDDLYKQRMRIRGVEVLGRREDIPRLVTEQDIGILVFAIHNINNDERHQLLEICASTPARVVMLPDFLGALNLVASQYSDLMGTVIVPGYPDDELKHYDGRNQVPRVQVDDWLSQLQKLVDSGDLQAVQTQIQLLRASLYSDKPTKPLVKE